VQTQRRFRREFDVPRHGRIPSRNAILKSVDSNVHGSVVNKYIAPARFVRTPESAERVRVIMQQSPTRSARRHVVSLQMSSRSLRRASHEYLRFIAYKIHVTHELRGHDKASSVNFCQHFLNVVDNDTVYMCKYILILNATSN
jgi:hypothetical protein